MDRVEARLKELQVERDQLADTLKEAQRKVPKVELHPSALRQFIRKLERIKQVIENEGNIFDRAASEAFRAAVSHIIVGDGEIEGDYEVDVVTYIAALTGQTDFIGYGHSLGGQMVAEVRSGQDSRHHERTEISLGTWQIRLGKAIKQYMLDRVPDAANSTLSASDVV